MCKRMLLLLVIIPVLFFVNCQKDLPEGPQNNNPFDTENSTTQGDPFNLTAILSNNTVTLQWDDIIFSSLQGYYVYRSIDGSGIMNKVDSTNNETTSWTNLDISKGHQYLYKVTAFDNNFNESNQSNTLAVQILTEPIIYINDNAPFAFSVTVQLTILAPTATSMMISNDSTFINANWEPYNRVNTWTLLENDAVQTVYAKMKYNDNLLSVVVSDDIIVDLTSPEMVYIPDGDFIMGSADDVGDSDEHPQHTVTVSGYWIDKYEVSNSQFALFLSDGNDYYYNNLMKINKGSDGQYTAESGVEDHPVIYVNYDAAKEYALWRNCSLPTEAQWERAAHGAEYKIYPWGDLLESNRANFWSSDDPYENVIPYISPVGFYDGNTYNAYDTKNSPSPYGVYDMAGNVSEWCSDWYKNDYYSISPDTNPIGPVSGDYRVIRGGSWRDEPYYCRTTSRSFSLPLERRDYIGFRCVKSSN